jgi:hypothetical protein
MERRMRRKLMLTVNMRKEDGNCEDNEAEMNDRNGEKSETVKSEQRLVTSKRKLTQKISCMTCFQIFIMFHMFAYSNSMKLIHKITFSMQACFLVQGHLTFRVIFHSGRYGNISSSNIFTK